jgi:hypothetical protein
VVDCAAERTPLFNDRGTIAMTGLISALQALASIGSLVCFIIVIVNLFQKGEQKLGIICLVLILVCGIGLLVTFIIGWMKAAQLRIQNVMMAWTACWLVGVILGIIQMALRS